MNQTKSSKRRRRYDSEFKSNALKMVEDGRSVSSVSQALGISENLLYNWRSQSRKQKQTNSNGLEAEVKQLRKRLKEVEQERDILKKALSIFSQPT